MAVEVEKLRSEEAACISRFYKIVLTWDIFRIIQEVEKRNKEKGNIDEGLGFGEVKDTDTDVNDYISTYEPLLFEEIKSEIASNKNCLGADKRTLVKNWDAKDDGFIIATVCVDMDEGEGDDEQRKIKPNDLFLLSKTLWSKPMVPDENSFKKYAFALVESRNYKESTITLRMYLAGEVRGLNTDDIQFSSRLTQVRSLVTSNIEGDKLFDVTKIRSFPSEEFYENSLEDGPNIKEQTKRSWHEYSCFGPFCFFDLHEAEEVNHQASWVYADEVEFVLNLYLKLVSCYPELKSSNKFAIISPYRAQVQLLKERFKTTFGVDSEKEVEITTVDGCQGREKDVAIFSCVRASKKGKIGFVEDFRRMNVGITRAKASILVVGSASTLKRSEEHWKNFVESAEKRQCLIKISKPYTSFFSIENLETMRTQSEIMPTEEIKKDESDYGMLAYTAGDADEVQGDDIGYGDGDEMDMDDGGFEGD